MLAEASPGGHVEHTLQMVGRSLNVFIGNARELYGALQHLQHPDASMKPPEPGTTGWEEIDEMNQLMHNFLSASFTLTGITIKARKEVGSDDFTEAYERHSPSANPVCVIMKAVRNDVQDAHLAGIENFLDPVPPNPEDPNTIGLKRRFFLVRKYLATLDLDATAQEVRSGAAR